MDLIEQLQNIAERARQRERERRANEADAPAAADPGPAPSAKILKLPVEPAGRRTTPNVCLRSALFGVVGRGRRRWLIDAEIAAQDGYRVLYTGERLDQSDLDVWLAIKHLCSRVPLGAEVQFSAPELFRLLGKSDGQANREALKRSLKRMKEASVSMVAPSGAGFQGNMIDWWKWDAESCRFSVVLSPRMAPLFEDEDYTLLVNAQRQQLGKDLTRWLHGYWSSHQRIYPIYDTTLMKLCGAEFGVVRDFRKDLREALAELEAVGFLAPGWTVDRHGRVTATKVTKTKTLDKPR
jgi:hypothetical protein